ncbi:MAG: fibronectin type III domain-containing protein, partial [Steroidobacter sp.]
AILFVLLAAPLTAQSASATYGYDSKGRVSSITYDDGTVVDYLYDANGNRTSATRTTPPPDTTPPSAPGTPSFSNVTMTSAKVDWSPATDNRGVVGYDYRVNSGSWQSLSNVLTVSLTGLSAATAYTVSVRAKDAASNVGAAASNSFTTPDTAAPSVPTGLAGSAPNSGAVNLSWAASTDNVGVTGYRIYRGGVHIADTTSTSYSNTGLSGSTTYSYQVSARDAAGNFSGLSSAVGVTTPDTIAPSAPTSLSASAVSSTQINLSWSGSSDTGGSGLAGYRVYRNGAHLGNTTATSFASTGLATSTTYSYTVAAYDNAANTSGQSNSASATTLGPLSATVSNTTWNWLRFPNGNTSMDPSIVVTASGGSGAGYTYAWQYVSGDTQTSVVNPTSNSTHWSRSMPNSNVTFTSVWRCLVTDTAGATVYTPTVTVTFTRHTIE